MGINILPITDYKTVPDSWRERVKTSSERYTVLLKREPANPLTKELLKGNTILYHPDERGRQPFSSMYAVASRHGRKLKIYNYEDFECPRKHFLIWME